MSILVNADTKVIVQGITGGQGRFYALRNRAYGTKIVGGVSPKKAGTDVDGIPVFASVADAVRETGATATMVIVPAAGAAAAVLEAAEAGLELIVAVTEGIPMHDEARCVQPGRARLSVVADPRTELSGPADGRRVQHRFHPGRGRACRVGRSGIVSRSGTLTYQALERPGAEGHRRDDVRRHRWRPGSGHELHRLSLVVRSGPRHQGRDHVRRDRRFRRGRGRRLHPHEDVEAGGQLHRGRDRAARQEDGSRGRNRVGLQGHRAGEDGCALGRRACGSRRIPPPRAS